MKLQAHIALCLGMFLSATELSAQNSTLLFSKPPMQSKSWKLSCTNPPPGLESAINVLFKAGMADPRGCDYREIEIVIGNLANASAATNKTHGWILPATNKGANYAIGWNGLIYPVVSIGNSANAEDDAHAMIQAMAKHELRYQSWASEDYSLGIQWLTPAKAVMIFRFARPELAEECAKTLGHDDSFLMMASDWLWDAFERTISAHARGDDALAYTTAITLEQAQKICEAEAKAHGFELQPTPRGNGIYSAKDEERKFYFPFLKTFPELLQDQERRHQRKIPLRNPVVATNKEERITAMIDQLENVSARPHGPYYADYDLTGSPTVQALVQEGWAAIEPLLNCYEHDKRLTRIVPQSHFDWPPNETIVDVRSAAYTALEEIIETTHFAPQLSRNQTAQEKEAAYAASATGIRNYWMKYRGLSRDERLYQILKDDNGQWLEAATIIVQPANIPVIPIASWGSTPWGMPIDLHDTSPMRGEALRAKMNPSTSELFEKRIKDALDKNTTYPDHSDTLNDACNLALCFAKWDPKAALETTRILSDLAFQKISPTNVYSFVTHMELAGQLPELITFRESVGDTNAFPDYAKWFTSSDPEGFFLQPRSLLTPLMKFPEDSAWKSIWPAIFEDDQSSWFKFLHKMSTPDPKRMQSSEFGIEELFSTPIVNNISFRKFAVQLLHDKSPCGKIVGEAAHGYWLDERLSTDRHFGYTVDAPHDGAEINGKEFRTCDFYAWLLSNRIEGAPEFQLYWPESKRDESIATIETMLQSNDIIFKNHPFQER